MGLFLKDENGRSQLQSKVASDLRDRLKDREKIELPEVESKFTENSHETRPAGIIIVALFLLLVIILTVWALQLGGIL